MLNTIGNVIKSGAEKAVEFVSENGAKIAIYAFEGVLQGFALENVAEHINITLPKQESVK